MGGARLGGGPLDGSWLEGGQPGTCQSGGCDSGARGTCGSVLGCAGLGRRCTGNCKSIDYVTRHHCDVTRVAFQFSSWKASERCCI